MTTYQISVRSFVEFLLKSGNIDNRQRASQEDAMQQGSRIHRRIQKERGPLYCAESYLSYTHDTEEYSIVIDGRADGIFPFGETVFSEEPAFLRALGTGAFSLPEKKSGKDTVMDGQLSLFDEEPETVAVSPDKELEFKKEPPENGGEDSFPKMTPVIEEIKTTYRNILKMEEPVPVHLAQAKCYAYFYCTEHICTHIRILMTYVHIDSGETRYFLEKCTAEDLKKWFDGMMAAYLPWMNYRFSWEQLRTSSIRETTFPFAYREGQRDLAAHVYRTIVHGKKLFLEAPTGSGKTLATLFPSIKAIGEKKASRLFYLTSRTTLRSLAEDAIELMRGHSGLRFKSVTLTAKEKICFTEKHECNPEDCPYANGHFDRINEALFDLITHEESFPREVIEVYARKHKVCPFELSLDASLFADAVIGDYNYLFDPFVYLRRFFGDYQKTDSIFLVDEAHNLVDRGRSMYSAELCEEELAHVDREIAKSRPLTGVRKKLDKLLAELIMLENTAAQAQGSLQYAVIDETEVFYDRLQDLSKAIAAYLDDRSGKRPHKEIILELYLQLYRFSVIYDGKDKRYRFYGTRDKTHGFTLHLYCVDPSKDLARMMDKGISTVLFSATLLPVQYYKRLLGGSSEDFEVYASTTFDSKKCLRLIVEDVTSRYRDRSDSLYRKLSQTIREVVDERKGNYMVFFPSFAFMNEVATRFTEDENVMLADPLTFSEEETKRARVCLMMQTSGMSEESREAFLEAFRKESLTPHPGGESDASLLGFCVMGGIFSEGIDLSGEALIGALVVGTGLPQVCTEREILKNWFDDNNENGFDMAYRYPGLCRVLQASGRVIRTQEDIGLVALLDGRFAEKAYKPLFPREWGTIPACETERVRPMIADFWKKWDRGL